MDLKLVKNLLDLISESDVNEVSLQEGDFKIKVKKVSDKETHSVQYQMPAQTAQPSQPQSPPEQSAPQPAQQEKAEDEQPEGDVVKSPIVGTFYEAPSPESDPFVSVGDHVKEGETLCIVEAMKIMNEIEAEFSGTVQKILVNDASPVEFEQPLFIIKKD
ncbi:MAG: acetyl-CoA carboxylase biotin carboxyl carrier protein [Bacteroidetes bacterium]|jgi:acetyl-CoA carboxylase biotin carboxyl carrier protein|nr:acetyl-CoA carboxylase biotin carboxyl carrier protein [Bacteroidota bacterium]